MHWPSAHRVSLCTVKTSMLPQTLTLEPRHACQNKTQAARKSWGIRRTQDFATPFSSRESRALQQTTAWLQIGSLTASTRDLGAPGVPLLTVFPSTVAYRTPSPAGAHQGGCISSFPALRCWSTLRPPPASGMRLLQGRRSLESPESSF